MCRVCVCMTKVAEPQALHSSLNCSHKVSIQEFVWVFNACLRVCVFTKTTIIRSLHTYQCAQPILGKLWRCIKLVRQTLQHSHSYPRSWTHYNARLVGAVSVNDAGTAKRLHCVHSRNYSVLDNGYFKEINNVVGTNSVYSWFWTWDHQFKHSAKNQRIFGKIQMQNVLFYAATTTASLQ